MAENTTVGPTFPHIRKVGRYAFYLPCAFGLGILVAALLHAAGISHDFAREAVFPVCLVAFLALRDLEKNAEARAALLKASPRAGEGK